MPEDEPVRLQLPRHRLPSALVPKSAQRFLLTRVGDQIALEVGYVDFRELHEYLEAAKAMADSEPAHDLPPPPPFYVSDIFHMNIPSLLALHASVAQFIEQLQQIGALRIGTAEEQPPEDAL